MPQFMTPILNTSQKRKAGEDIDSVAKKRREDEHNIGSAENGTEQYWVVQWRNPQQKKHKTWDGDGVVRLKSSFCELSDDSGTPLCSGKTKVNRFESGTELTIGGKDLQLDHQLTRSDYYSRIRYTGTLAPNTVTSAPQPSHASSRTLIKPFTALRPTGASNSNSSALRSQIPLYPVNLISKPSSDLRSNYINPAILDSYWSAHWRKPQQKKHKTWEGDAYVTCTHGGKLRVISESGKLLGTKLISEDLYSGFQTVIGTREVELDASISKSLVPVVYSLEEEDQTELDLEAQPSSPRHRKSLLLEPDGAVTFSQHTSEPIPSIAKFVSPASFYGKVPEKPNSGPLHDPSAEGAVVMRSPTKEHAVKFNKKNLQIVPVVIDPILCRRLRPHQVEGIRFMYECVMGIRQLGGQGCILADEMGLGKTLQTITLVWTLLKQNPYAGTGPVIGKALIVCPVSLINNWKAEFHKWLGRDRLNVLVGDKDKAQIKQFLNSRQQVLIIGYEKLRTVIQDLSFCQPPIGLIICDEGHRLKSANNKTSAMFETLKTPRRIILSGTPIQNDLSEFHAMAAFCNPGLLDDYSTFRRNYETPILKSRTPNCLDKEKSLGDERAAQLAEIAKKFVLRREASILKGYLPPKHEYVVFITPTKLQLDILSKLLSKDKLDRLIGNGITDSLVMIGLLQKICNSPILLKATADKNKTKESNGGDDVTNGIIREALEYLPYKVQVEDVSLSGKLTALASLLRTIRKTTDDKVVIVSHWTSTLNIIEAFCKKKSYTYLRLDGSTPGAKRQAFVNDFNKSPQASRFLFLLSSKAGGVGINLIGASRLCLIDCDWNPSHDLQSMARIHRDGQRRPVFIYRFMTAGTIDEKIFQRQVTKMGLSASVMGTGNAESKFDSFTPKDLRDIFTIHPHTGCHTHDLLDCPCEGRNKPIPADELDNDNSTYSADEEVDIHKGFIPAHQINPGDIEKMDRAYMLKKKAQLASLGEWTHINCLQRSAHEQVKDEILGHILHKFKSDEEENMGLDVKPPSANKSRLDNLLDLTDISNVSTTEPKVKEPGLSVHDVPGGTISFIFEKFSDSTDAIDDD